MVKKLLDVDKIKTYKEFKEEGDKVEELFSEMAIKRSYKVTKATSWQDMNAHWDIMISTNLISYKVDIKGMKKACRNNDKYDPEWIWIELIGVKDMGWLNGEADLIAFEIPTGFVLIERIKLKEIVKKLVNFGKIVTNPLDAKYCLYSRQGRGDLITRVKLFDIEKEKFCKWEK